MADADRVRLSYVEEVTFGVTPSATMTDIRHTGESLGMDTSIARSAEIRSDRQDVDIARVSVQGAGDVNVEVSYAAHDDFLEAALQSAGWSSPVTVGPGITFAAVAGSGDYSITDSGSGLAGILVNQWVEIRGFATAANNGFAKVTASAAGSITVKGNGNGVNESAGASVTIVMGAQILNGTTERSFSIEKHFTDLTTTYELLRGMEVDGLNLSVVADQLLTGSFSFMGKDAIGATSSGGSGYTAAPENEIMNAVDDVLRILVDYVEVPSTQFTLALANNLRAKNQIAELGPVDIGSGKCTVTGTFQMYFEDNSEMNKYRNFTDTAFAIVTEDGSGNAYIIDVPRANYGGGRSNASGQNTDIIADLTIESARDATEGITVRIARFAA
jgi:hypothetical protein